MLAGTGVHAKALCFLFITLFIIISINFVQFIADENDLVLVDELQITIIIKLNVTAISWV